LTVAYLRFTFLNARKKHVAVMSESGQAGGLVGSPNGLTVKEIHVNSAKKNPKIGNMAATIYFTTAAHHFFLD
jgi:hypothetical protein